MKKKIFIFSTIILFLSFNSAFSEEINPKDQNSQESISAKNQNIKHNQDKSHPEKINLITFPLKFSAGFYTTLSFENSVSLNSQYYQLNFNLDMNELNANLGVSHKKNTEHFSTSICYSPTFYKYFKLGLENRFHFLIDSDDFSEFDFLCLGYFNYNNLKFFNTSLRFGYHFKNAYIFVINKKLINNSLALKIDFNFNIKNKFFPYFTITSFKNNKYNLFFSPAFIIGLESNINKKFNLGLETEFCYSDFFTLTSYLKSVDQTFFIKWTL